MTWRRLLPLAAAAVLVAQPLAAKPRDGSHDFDSEVGTWTVHTTRLMHPLAHAKDWMNYDGTKVVSAGWGGKANIAEVKEDGPAGHLRFVAIRLYDPASGQWSLNFTSAGNASFGQALYGGLRDGAMEFDGPDTFNGRTILVRFLTKTQDADHASSEQYFSDDGGRTWELNWINHYTRVKG